MNISVFGLGKLGAPLAAVLAHRGHQVVGVDVKPEIIDKVNAGMAPVSEPRLQDLLDTCRSRIRATLDPREAVLATDLSMIILPTPSNAAGVFVLQYVLPTAEEIGRAIRGKESYHVVDVVSTVMPGHTEGRILPALEAASGKRCGPDFGLCYNPEFIAIGNVVNDMLHPDFYLIGESDPRAGDLLQKLYATVCPDAPVRRMGLANAELAKIAVNTYVCMKISYANMLAEICERMPGGDVDEVTNAIGLDARIGKRYLTGALGYGGPCFPRDTIAFGVMAERLGVDAALSKAADRVNERQATRIVDLVLEWRKRNERVGLLGLSYRPDTALTERSQAFEIARSLDRQGVALAVHDPAARDQARATLSEAVAICESADDLVGRSDIVLLLTPWSQYRDIAALRDPETAPRLLFDCWGVIDAAELSPRTKYVRLGRYE